MSIKQTEVFIKVGLQYCYIRSLPCSLNKKAQLSLTNPRDACEKFARFT